MPAALSADDFIRLRLRYGAAPEPDELPAAVEHDFDAGRMVDHYLATPAPALLAGEAAAAAGPLRGVLFLQSRDAAPWRVVLCGGDNARAEFEMPCAEWDALLQKSGVVLPGQDGFVPPSPPLE